MPTLVVNQGALGDLLMSLPTLRLLRRHLGDFTLAGDPERCLFLRKSREVASVFPSNSAAFAQLFSGTIPPHLEYFDDVWWFTRRRGLVPTILMMPDSKVKAKVIFTVDEGPEEKNCSIFQFEQVKAELDKRDAQIEDFMAPLIHSLPLSERINFDLAVHPGSGSKKKNFSLSIFFDVVSRLLASRKDTSCCFIIGPAEMDMATEIEDFALGWNGRVKIASGFDLFALANLLGRVKAYWGNDSGVSHLAAWCGARTFINFGPTKPRLWTPLSGNVTIFQSLAPCSPCGESYRRCNEPVCLEQMDKDDVAEMLLSATIG